MRQCLRALFSSVIQPLPRKGQLCGAGGSSVNEKQGWLGVPVRLLQSGAVSKLNECMTVLLGMTACSHYSVELVR